MIFKKTSQNRLTILGWQLKLLALTLAPARGQYKTALPFAANPEAQDSVHVLPRGRASPHAVVLTFDCTLRGSTVHGAATPAATGSRKERIMCIEC